MEFPDHKTREVEALSRSASLVKRKLEVIYEKFINLQGADFERVLQFHMSLKNIKNVKEVFVKEPLKFKEAFIDIFGEAAWYIMLDVLKNICRKAGIEEKILEELFGLNRNEKERDILQNI